MVRYYLYKSPTLTNRSRSFLRIIFSKYYDYILFRGLSDSVTVCVYIALRVITLRITTSVLVYKRTAQQPYVSICLCSRQVINCTVYRCETFYSHLLISGYFSFFCVIILLREWRQVCWRERHLILLIFIIFLITLGLQVRYGVLRLLLFPLVLILKLLLQFTKFHWVSGYIICICNITALRK